MPLHVTYVIYVICISKKHLKKKISKTKQGNKKLKDNLLLYFKYSFK